MVAATASYPSGERPRDIAVRRRRGGIELAVVAVVLIVGRGRCGGRVRGVRRGGDRRGRRGGSRGWQSCLSFGGGRGSGTATRHFRRFARAVPTRPTKNPQYENHSAAENVGFERARQQHQRNRAQAGADQEGVAR